MLALKLTCGACPEQYDAFDESGKLVGYLRLRHGWFRADVPLDDDKWHTVYEAWPKGDGIFEDDERDYYLRWAVKSIEDWLKNPVKDPNPKLPAAPDVEYRVDGTTWSQWAEVNTSWEAGDLPGGLGDDEGKGKGPEENKG